MLISGVSKHGTENHPSAMKLRLLFFAVCFPRSHRSANDRHFPSRLVDMRCMPIIELLRWEEQGWKIQRVLECAHESALCKWHVPHVVDKGACSPHAAPWLFKSLSL